jgi:hypothetical protein
LVEAQGIFPGVIVFAVKRRMRGMKTHHSLGLLQAPSASACATNEPGLAGARTN